MRSTEESIGLFISSNQYGEVGPEVQTARLRALTLELGRLGTRTSVKTFTGCSDGINPNGLVKRQSSVFIFPPQDVIISSSFVGRNDKLPDGTIKEFETYDYDEALVAGKVEIQYHVGPNQSAHLTITDKMEDSDLPHDVIMAINQAFPASSEKILG